MNEITTLPAEVAQIAENVSVEKRNKHKYNKELPKELIKKHKIEQLKKQIKEKENSIEYFKTNNNNIIERYTKEKNELENQLFNLIK